MTVDQVCLHEAMLAGAAEVFETMIFMDVRPATTDEKRDLPAGAGTSPPHGRRARDDSSIVHHPSSFRPSFLLGSITFTGDLEGCLGICCSVPCARAIAQNMLGLTQTDELGEAEITDAIGEVVNMVMGSVKSRIQANIGSLNVSIPTVVRGQALDNTIGDHTNTTNRVLTKLNIADEHTAELSLQYRQRTK